MPRQRQIREVGANGVIPNESGNELGISRFNQVIPSDFYPIENVMGDEWYRDCTFLWLATNMRGILTTDALGKEFQYNRLNAG